MKKYLLAGLLVWLPLAVTIWVLLWVVGLLNGVFNSLVSAAKTVLPPAGVEALEEARRAAA